MFSCFTTTQKGILAAFTGFTGFALADATSKWLSAHYQTLDIIFWTYLFCLIFGLCLSPKLGGVRKTLQTPKLLIHIARGVCALGIGLCVVSALSNGLKLSALYTVLFLAPFITTIAAIPIYGERVPLRNWMIIACGFSGILVAFHDGLAAITLEVVYALCALIFIVCLALLARPLTKSESLHSLSFYPSLTIVVLLGASVIPTIAFPAPEHLIVFILNGMFVTAGLTGIACGYRLAPYAVIAPVQYSQMVLALIIGYLVFGDIPDVWMMCGASIIMSSGLMLIMNRQRT